MNITRIVGIPHYNRTLTKKELKEEWQVKVTKGEKVPMIKNMPKDGTESSAIPEKRKKKIDINVF